MGCDSDDAFEHIFLLLQTVPNSCPIPAFHAVCHDGNRFTWVGFVRELALMCHDDNRFTWVGFVRELALSATYTMLDKNNS